MGLIGRITNKVAKIGIIGLGYVGLPLVIEFLHCTKIKLEQRFSGSLRNDRDSLEGTLIPMGD